MLRSEGYTDCQARNALCNSKSHKKSRSFAALYAPYSSIFRFLYLILSDEALTLLVCLPTQWVPYHFPTRHWTMTSIVVGEVSTPTAVL